MKSKQIQENFSYTEKEISEGAYVYSGYAFKSKDFDSFGIPVVKIGNIKNRAISLEQTQFFPKNLVNEKLDKFYLKDNDVLIAMTGQGSVGRVGKIRLKENQKVLLNQRVGRFVADEQNLHLDFLFHVISSKKYEQILFDVGSGTGQPNLSPEMIQSVKIPIPIIATQRKIAKILSDLDTKIQNLQEQNKTLEQTAQAIFQSWFVDFDGITEFEDSELGKIPKGWSVKQIKDFCKVRRGASPRPVGDPKYFGGDIPWIKIADVSKSPSPYLFSTKETVTEEGAKKSVHLPKNSLIISNSGTVGKPIFLTRDGCIHDGWLYFENLIEISQEFLYFHILTLTTHLNLIGDGTVQKNLNTTMVGEIKFVCPEKKYLDSFLKISQIFLKTIKENQIKINTLISIRDALLPKLMSGEIRV